MLDLIKKETFTNEELEQLDLYFKDKIEDLIKLDNKTIINFINNIN